MGEFNRFSGGEASGTLQGADASVAAAQGKPLHGGAVGRLAALVQWVFRMWPVLLPFALMATHYALASHIGAPMAPVSKVMSYLLQVAGGIIVLYSINANLVMQNHTSLADLAKVYLRAFPLRRTTATTTAEPAASAPLKPRAFTWPGLRGKSTTERLKHLHQQIEQIRESVNRETGVSVAEVEALEQQAAEVTQQARETIVCINRKVQKLCLCTVKMQLFGVLLMMHGFLAQFLF